MASRTDQYGDLEAELRALADEVEVPPTPDVAKTVRARVDHRNTRSRGFGRAGVAWLRRPAWKIAVAIVIVLVSLLVATPQGRAVIEHVVRFAGIEFSRQPTSSPSPHPSASLPGERQMSLKKARQQVSFPIRVPAALGRPDEVTVSDHGRVATLAYHHTTYGEVRLDEFDGHLDPVYFKKLVYDNTVTKTTVAGRKALWIKGPHEISYVTRRGMTENASARLTRGNTLIWDGPRVALRLEGQLDKHDARVIAGSVH